MGADATPSDERRRCEQILLEADRLLTPEHAANAEPTLSRLRLARAELATKVLKVRAAREATHVASEELSDAIERVLDEMAATRRALERGAD